MQCYAPNNAFQPTLWPRVARPRFPRSLRSLGAAERGRYMATTRGLACASFVLLCAAFPLQAIADYKRCFETGTTIDINDCLGDEFQKLHNQLEQTYQRTVKGLTPDAGRSLDEAQKAWMEFREKDCRAVYEFWKAGSIRNTKYMVCLIEKTRGRIAELRRWPPK